MVPFFLSFLRRSFILSSAYVVFACATLINIIRGLLINFFHVLKDQYFFELMADSRVQLRFVYFLSFIFDLVNLLSFYR